MECASRSLVLNLPIPVFSGRDYCLLGEGPQAPSPSLSPLDAPGPLHKPLFLRHRPSRPWLWDFCGWNSTFREVPKPPRQLALPLF